MDYILTILNDFNIRIELYSENANSTIFETISRAILETGNNRILTFHSLYFHLASIILISYLVCNL
jgi:hypothetical protein